ncbi:hypothetical protein AB0H07_38965 [Streptomyces sp. NPDC021354]|uniref:hypothetical protein n=1 Tax=Streptomyces sp. NPDC021354 TaxID=3154793 RepID=UPI0033FA3206
MPEVRVEFSEAEMRGLDAAATEAGLSVTRYVHDSAVRAQQRQDFVASAVRFFDRHAEEFDAAFPEDAPSQRAA